MSDDFNLEFLWKDLGSGGNGCPALITGTFEGKDVYYVQGDKVVDPNERAAVQAMAEANNSGLGPDEEVIRVRVNVLDRLRNS